MQYNLWQSNASEAPIQSNTISKSIVVYGWRGEVLKQPELRRKALSTKAGQRILQAETANLKQSELENDSTMPP